MSEKTVVLPGQKIDVDARRHTYKENGQKYSGIYGVLITHDDRGKIIPINGTYVPKEDDAVIAIVESVKHGGCVTDIGTSNSAFMITRRDHEYADTSLAQVIEVDEVNSARLKERKQLHGGILIEVDPVKIPRIIGKDNSMIDMIQKETDTKIIAGRNGRVWIKGENTNKAIEAIRLVAKKTHISGLTDHIKKFLTGEQE